MIVNIHNPHVCGIMYKSRDIAIQKYQKKKYHSAIDTMYNWEVKNTANSNTKKFIARK